MPELDAIGKLNMMLKRPKKNTLGYKMDNVVVETGMDDSWIVMVSSLLSTHDSCVGQDADFRKAVDICFEQWQKISNSYNVILTREQDIGDWFTLDEFVAMCKEGGFIDYDGTGLLSFDGKTACYRPEDRIWPSRILKDNYDHEATHVVWFNK